MMGIICEKTIFYDVQLLSVLTNLEIQKNNIKVELKTVNRVQSANYYNQLYCFYLASFLFLQIMRLESIDSRLLMLITLLNKQKERSSK